jgi:porin
MICRFECLLRGGLAALFVAASTIAAADADVTPCQRFDQLRPRGTEDPAISMCETLSPDWGGVRDELTDNGVLIAGGTSGGGTYDLLDHREHPQLYIGQDPTARLVSYLYATYELNRVGFTDSSQLVFHADYQMYSYSPESPSGLALDSLYINQPFNDGHLQLQYGYEELQNQFYGFSLGTNSTTSPVGISSSIPFEVGLIPNKSAPELNLRWAPGESGVYDRFGVTRGESPDGDQADWDGNKALGLSWHVPGAKALFINELGYQTDSTPQTNMTWLRQGVIFNETHYATFRDGEMSRNNYAYYLIGDFQLTQTDAMRPFRGLYINAKVDYAPPDRNVYSSDAGITFYLLGPADRAYDVLSLNYTYSGLSRLFQYSQNALGLSAADFSSTTAAEYVFRLKRGIYFSNQLSYTVNPIPEPRRSPALNWKSSISFSY